MGANRHFKLEMMSYTKALTTLSKA